MDARELRAEQEYAAHVQQLLLALIEQSQEISAGHLESIRMITADAWEELRVRPTQISPEEMQQLATEVDRFVARREFVENLARRACTVCPTSTAASRCMTGARRCAACITTRCPAAHPI